MTSWFKRLGKSFYSGPETREELLEQLKSARSRALIDMDALDMIEGVLSVSALRVRDIMIPRAEMAVLNRDDDLEKLLPLAIDTAHSRFPVINDDKAEIIGILLAKDLLQYCGTTKKIFNIRDVLRNAVFVPESKRLNVLLKEFRTRRNHMAIVIDEYGAAAGLVTIEDVLEQIVGEIEDEYDFEEDVQILQRTDNEYTVKAQVEIEDFNLHFNSNLDDKEFDTIGGLVTNAIGHLPKRGERVTIENFEFRVIRADSRKIRLLALHLLQ
ncbi:MAG: CBS domain-containing protein [Gammaproteobacteria bacterium]|nr:CBS domain-containing protein [Gammaproteobacteria bacterium]